MALRKQFKARRFDFDVNIVPIVDCLTILIIFMLASGVYVSMGMLDIKISPLSDGATLSKTPTTENLVLRLNNDHTINIEVSGSSFQRLSIRPRANTWDYLGLEREMRTLARVYPNLKTVSVEPSQDVSYQDVVRAMEVSRTTHPDVLLGGF